MADSKSKDSTSSKDTKDVTLGVDDYRVSSFDFGIRGVAPIRSVATGGTSVGSTHLDSVKKAAQKQGVAITQMS